MLEVLIIYSFIYAARFWKFRGKSFEQLTESEQQKLSDAYQKDRKGKIKYQFKEYLPSVQKRALSYLITGIVLSIVWVLVLLYVYPELMAAQY